VRTTLVVYANGDDALLLWTADRVDSGCIGFAIERRLSRGGATKTAWLDNYAPPPKTASGLGQHQSSVDWPFRRFTWTDHSVGAGDRVSFRVVPVFDEGPDPARGSSWSKTVRLGWPASAKYRAFFNRGFVISQFMSRYLDEHYPGLSRPQALKRFKADAAQAEDRLRVFLSGQLRTELLDVLETIRGDGDHVYAALFELGDPELVDALAALGPRAHVVLANGAIEVKKDPVTKKAIETSAEARKRDENKAGRRRLLDGDVDVERKNRFVSPGALAHNKFLVVTDANGKPKRVWTGSTNWTTTGLCTQLNNGLLVDDARVGTSYLKQWQALRAAASGHPRDLAAGNNTATDVGTAGTRTSVRFTRTQRRVDLDALGAIVAGANEGVLFLMFIPGASGVLADIRALQQAKPSLLVRGVVSDLPKGRQDEKTGNSTTVRVTLVGGPDASLDGTTTHDVVQPEGKAHPTAYWAAETTRRQFAAVGHAIIHSKVLVVDPFSDDPTVVTGSHNFSISASSKNDETFIVVRGDSRLAEAYAVNVQSAWRHYAARVGTPHANLGGVDYLRALLNDQRPNDAFWRLT
jgi:phosphatidylserine/phosphatidylglycerophosphate/cardiolipin synthase-like enzyme